MVVGLDRSVVCKSFTQTRSASSGDGGEQVPCRPDLEDCGEKGFYYSEFPTTATHRQTHDRPVEYGTRRPDPRSRYDSKHDTE